MDQTYAMVMWFVVGAAVINGLVYGGITWVYFADKHRVDPAGRHEAQERPLPAPVVAGSREHRAA